MHTATSRSWKCHMFIKRDQPLHEEKSCFLKSSIFCKEVQIQKWAMYYTQENWSRVFLLNDFILNYITTKYKAHVFIFHVVFRLEVECIFFSIILLYQRNIMTAEVEKRIVKKIVNVKETEVWFHFRFLLHFL